MSFSSNDESFDGKEKEILRFLKEEFRNALSMDSLDLLIAFVKKTKKKTFQYILWTDFICGNLRRSAINDINLSLNIKNRAIKCICYILAYSKDLVKSATLSTHVKSFISLSERIGEDLVAIINDVLKTLKNELDVDVICSLCQCLTIIITHANFEKISMDILVETFKSIIQIESVLDSQKIELSVAILISQYFMKETYFPHLRKILNNETFLNDLISKWKKSKGKLRIEYYNLFSLYFIVILPTGGISRDIWNCFQNEMLADLSNPSFTEKASLFLENFSETMKKTDEDLVKQRICNILSNISTDVFDAFPRPKRVFVMTLLLGFASDVSSKQLRAASCRALGTLTLYQSIQEVLL
ncbi:hypothetical protein ROZALSC1DRAFT_22716 [Rozella allomycis CSF55]|uniref:DUF4042 domain-containing protein n=1 Tax=Rozella allomycis (strain CSF55) TaxID=988480 RepID=A0A4P9YHF3_ROZAC|nr:hypothetical protein ROZALSC1DRAFT_22716 [Rozella allomycis CSF55]